MRSRSALLVLADGRLPTGGYAHSAGLEQAIRQGWVNDIDGLRDLRERPGPGPDAGPGFGAGPGPDAGSGTDADTVEAGPAVGDAAGNAAGRQTA